MYPTCILKDVATMNADTYFCSKSDPNTKDAPLVEKRLKANEGLWLKMKNLDAVQKTDEEDVLNNINKIAEELAGK